MKRAVLCVVAAVAISMGCASGHVQKLNDTKIQGPKVIVLSAPNAPWVYEIQRRLQEKGFKVLRWSSRAQVTIKKVDVETTFNKAEARYILEVDGSAPTDWANRCFGGGYNFDFINVDLIDTQTNMTLLNINGSGFSEGCPPLSGTIYTDIVEAVSNAWGSQ